MPKTVENLEYKKNALLAIKLLTVLFGSLNLDLKLAPPMGRIQNHWPSKLNSPDGRIFEFILLIVINRNADEFIFGNNDMV